MSAQEGVRLATWPRSPECRDGDCPKCYGTAWDLERDQAVDCQCGCHTADPPAICPDCGYASPTHRLGCNREF